jgi:aminoglycoside/choline kinase family phosphotransferase
MLETLAAMDPNGLGLPQYDYRALAGEMALFPEWFCDGLLGMPLEGGARDLYDALERALCERARDQRQVLVHRDFHARNLMVLNDGDLATIDFQDAIIGPVTYDPVSLLRDCYLRWPVEDVRRWALMHRENLLRRGIAVPHPDAFLKDFDWMGLQRHIKVLGIFARLDRRDGKPGYLPDLPRVLAYVREVLAAYPGDTALADFAAWFDEAVMPRALAQPWYRDLGDLPA